jgi:Glycosyl hydrolases family 16
MLTLAGEKHELPGLRTRLVSAYVAFVLVFGLGAAALGVGKKKTVQLEAARCEIPPHDKEPWYTPVTAKDGLCQIPESLAPSLVYPKMRADTFETVSAANWEKLTNSWSCNQALFAPDRVSVSPTDGLQLSLIKRSKGDKPFAAGSIGSPADQRFLYGRFETVMRAAKGDGIVSAFFLYRYNPWQEIDIEFLGKKTTKMMVNVFYNPGKEGNEFNHGLLGTPTVIDLGFDAAADFHKYAIEWDEKEIRWFVDDRLVHRRRDQIPSPIPHLPMRLYLNIWAPCSEGFAGVLKPETLPASAKFRSVNIYAKPVK